MAVLVLLLPDRHVGHVLLLQFWSLEDVLGLVGLSGLLLDCDLRFLLKERNHPAPFLLGS